MHRHLLPLCLAGLLAGTAQADVVDIAWSADQRFERQLAVAPGAFAEVCGKLARGESVAWRFEADRALAFNIHYHVGKAVEYPARQDAATRADGTLAVALDQDYCWMWTNRTRAPATLKLTLSK